MSVTNEFSSLIHNDHMVPLDIRYTDFLNALSDIPDENMRNRCHKYWTSLYRYFDRSMTNERALLLEEKRTHEILHRLNMEMASRRSKTAYQIRNILQRGHQVLADLHIKYNQKKNNSREFEQNIDHLENQIQKQKSEHSLITVSSSTSLNEITETIDNLKSQIKNLRITRETYQSELNIKRSNYFSTQIKAYHVQENLHKTEKELIEIQHEVTLNRKAVYERNNQLHQYKQNIPILIDQKYLNIDFQLIKEQLNNEQNLSFQLKKQNKDLNNNLLSQITILKTTENKQIELNLTTKNFIDIIHKKHEEIVKEKEIKENLSKLLIQLNIQLKRKKNIISFDHQQENKFKNQIIELEYKREKYLPQSLSHSSTNNLKKSIYQEVNDRLKLTIIHSNLKHQINNLENTTQEYFILVKEQRQKIINYEKIHDKWILNINLNRNRLLELFNRIYFIEQYIINTNKFLQQFHSIKFSLRSNILILYNKINLFIQKRREKNENETNEKSSLNIKFYQIKQLFQSKQSIIDRIKQNISLINKNHLILHNQISTINKQRFHLIQNLDFLQNKSCTKQQQILNITNKSNHIKHLIDSHHQKYQKFTLEKQNIIFLLLKKQHFIVLINKHINFNEKILIKHRLCYNKVLNKLQQIRNQVLHEIQQIKSFKKRSQPDLKQLILHLRKELLEYKKKNNHFQHRRYITQQILTNFGHKSISKENNEKYQINFQEKTSSIIYRLICKTHYNIILHKRLDLLMQNIILLYYTDQKIFQNSSIYQSNNSFHLNNQLKSSIAELRVLKNEIFIYHQTYINIKYSLENHFLL